MSIILYLCDWLPPDFGAVGQYAMVRAERWAREGDSVTVVGLSSTASSVEQTKVGTGSLRVVRLHAKPYDRTNLRARALWTACTNSRILWRARRALLACDEVFFTACPPYLLHWVAPAGLLLRKRMVYRITDFHPECLMAALPRAPMPLRALHRLTKFWRLRVDRFEALGQDQRRLLVQMGIPPGRIGIQRDPSPVRVAPGQAPLALPHALRGRRILLYSGNWGAAHDEATFVHGYRAYHSVLRGAALALWLNATGAGADRVERQLIQAKLPVHRSHLLPLSQLPALMAAADVHLITLKDAFVGLVMPSKVYSCIESGKPILYIGSQGSDVHQLCAQALPPDRYRRADVGDSAGVVSALTHFEKLSDATR